MALKIAIPPPASLMDKRQMALARARFTAWWNGEPFDAEAAALAVDEALAAAPKKEKDKSARDKSSGAGASDDDLFAAPETPDAERLAALQRIWGAGRLMPGDPGEESLLVARLGLPATARLGVFGPGLGAPVAGLAVSHLGPILVYEWRDEAKAALQATLSTHKAAKRITLAHIDLETFAAPNEKLDGLISFDEFTYADNAARLAQTFAKSVAEKGVAAIECYCALPGHDVSTAFASAFAEPHLRASGDIQDLLQDAGFRVDSADDVTEEHLALSREGFRRLGETLKDVAQLTPNQARELAWEAEAWRDRVRLLGAKRIERRLFTATRRG
jgi:hypothetical protein